MLSDQDIAKAVGKLVAAAHEPLQVILFGSYARGQATERSDLDLIVVERDTANLSDEMIRLQDAIGNLDVDVDLLVYSQDEFEKRRNWSSTPVYWAVREGKVVYDHRQ